MGEHTLADQGEPGSRGSSAPGRRGRAPEWRLIDGLIAGAPAGHGGVLLVEGPPGIGKSRLLDEAAAAAARAGLDVAGGAADLLTQPIPLSPLMSALGEEPATPSASGAAEQRLRAALERRAAARPLLLTLDDVHWADPMTLLALRSMTRDLSSYPLVWMLARTTGHGDGRRVGHLFDVLTADGATRITLRALDEAAVAEVVADVLGAAPEPDVLDLAGLAAGRPSLLIALLDGLRGEGVLRVGDGRVRTVQERLPRAQAVTGALLRELSPPTGRLLRAAGVLGRSFAVQDLADLLGEPTGRLMPMLEEAISAGVVQAAEHELTFRHDVLWHSVTASIPAPVRQALHRDAGEMLLRRGGSAVPAAAHLIRGATPGDAAALRGLDRAAREVLRTSPGTAADFALRALELSGPADPGRLGRATTAVEALTAVGRLPEAADLARTALGMASPAEALRLRCSLAHILLLSGRPDETLLEAESVLAQSGVPEDLRGAAEWAMFWGLICLNDARPGRQRAQEVLAHRERHTDAVVVGALLLLARLAVVDGRVADSFQHLHEALRLTNRGAAEPVQRPYARLLLSLNHRAMRQFEASELAVRAAEEEIQALGLTVLAAQPALFRSVLRLAAGELDDAADEAQAGMTIAEELGTHGCVRVGAAMLALVALRRGDLDAAVRHVEHYHAVHAAPGMLFGSVWERWATASLAEAQGDPDRAVEILDAIYTDAGERRWALLTTPVMAAWMTRLALGTGNHAYARTVVDTADVLTRENPDFPVVGVSAAHARGILHGDADALATAVTDQPEPWARASAAEDLGALLAAAPGDAGRERAVHHLDQALGDYQHIGALRDAARVRARLRALGVRRRHWSQTQRPAFGWDSLTDTEREVAGLIAQGLTNRQAAERMFLSPHTVSTHLRRIFAKLDIASRVELAGIVAEQHPALLRH
ncbi:helix-turn-helix transcriptional regulator [Nonomuraea maritima]|uniref:helix-turn-helix transcriptional regulator n=1 Tax=Nonomuraea maritima TaxID=683260 RepID=UPI00370FBE19